ncbi:MAG: PilZ domain-containing protein [Clostridium argentinense]|uniref:PilZ domain-containing protein n=1 Tax=Clostridium faecium TaxID=2762223 RepID=A0ABR8YQD2_9CLOT|nr:MULTISPECIES: flagellar brake domain-containing protein [Clostridium]MBD8046450.1 PilZ domain-containing protein [Clostridium faecium]MBS5824299.1 PilZ domain-containing protein [Clostridium argentinense]MDU1348963.1 PilZ domain-containing protein [Clostridium argentinense]
MASNINFYPNNRIKFVTEEGYAKSIIQDVDEKTLSIGLPMINQTYLAMRQGEVYEAVYNDGYGNVFKFKVDVIGRKFEKIPLIVISRPYDIKKIQRREYVRISYTGIVNYYLTANYPDKEINKYDIKDFNVGYALDLSGGGMKIKIGEKVNKGDYVIAQIKIDDEEIITLGRVVRVECDKDGKYICGLIFLTIEKNEREKLIGYIFNEMRKTLKTNRGDGRE